MAKSGQEIKVDYGRAVSTAKNAVSMLHNKQYPFNVKNLDDLFPDKKMPKGMRAGSKRHALYLFYGCVLDEGRLADVVYEAVRGFAETEDITKLHRLDRNELLEKLKPHFKSFGNPETSITNPVDTLLYNAQKIHIEYKGDPRLILEDDINATIKAIRFGKTKNPKEKFKQYGYGKAALLMKNFVEFGMWDFSPYEIPIKIDRHVMRISLGTGVVISPKDMTRGRVETLVKALTEVYYDVCRNEKISAIELDDSMWAIGRYKCRKNNDVYCQTTCAIGCNYRPRLEGIKGTIGRRSKGRAIYYAPNTEIRKNMNNLFRWVQDNSKN